jgi:hypothetical protein
LPCYNFRLLFWKCVGVSLQFFTDVIMRAMLHPAGSDCTSRSSRYKINCKSQWHLVVRDNSDRLHRNMGHAFCARVERQVNNKAKSLLCSQKRVFSIYTPRYKYHPRRGLPNAVFFFLRFSHTDFMRLSSLPRYMFCWGNYRFWIS